VVPVCTAILAGNAGEATTHGSRHGNELTTETQHK
jgi:hypothetical protein